MFHKKRRFQIGEVHSAPELASKLKGSTWTLCTGFRFRGTLWLNDSISEDAAQEYAVVREADMVQMESITVSWCDRDNLVKYIREAAEDQMEVMFGPIANQVEEAADHGRCHRCA